MVIYLKKKGHLLFYKIKDQDIFALFQDMENDVPPFATLTGLPGMKKMEFDFDGRHLTIYNYHVVNIIDLDSGEPEIVHTFTIQEMTDFKAILDL